MSTILTVPLIDESTGAKAVVVYDEAERHFELKPGQGFTAQLQNKVRDYLTTSRTYLLPVERLEEGELDGVQEVQAVPTEELHLFELALCSLAAATGVMVNWAEERKEEVE